MSQPDACIRPYRGALRLLSIACVQPYGGALDLLLRNHSTTAHLLDGKGCAHWPVRRGGLICSRLALLGLASALLFCHAGRRQDRLLVLTPKASCSSSLSHTTTHLPDLSLAAYGSSARVTHTTMLSMSSLRPKVAFSLLMPHTMCCLSVIRTVGCMGRSDTQCVA